MPICYSQKLAMQCQATEADSSVTGLLFANSELTVI